MVAKKVTVKNPSGLHLRPAGILCTKAIMYSSSVQFRLKDNIYANAKSVLSILGACVKCGDTIEFICEGDDEVEALAAMVAVVEGGLGE